MGGYIQAPWWRGTFCQLLGTPPHTHSCWCFCALRQHSPHLSVNTWSLSESQFFHL